MYMDMKTCVHVYIYGYRVIDKSITRNKWSDMCTCVCTWICRHVYMYIYMDLAPFITEVHVDLSPLQFCGVYI